MREGQPAPLRRRSETRRRLLAAAAELFDERGTISQSVEEISTRAGYTRGAFYSNFATVDELYLALHQEQSAAVWTRLHHAIDVEVSADAADTTLDEAVAHLLDSLPGDREWFSLRTVLLAKAAADPAFAEALSIDRGEVAGELGERLVAFARAHGRDPVVDASVLAKAVVAAHVGAVGLSPVDADAARTRRTVVAAVIRGLTDVSGEREPDREHP
ncbi:TetR/AcrR family transcriptional regulator [Microbacterium sp. SORGH_AS_0888]|uniref:TetR/AcrR family transcriptional regulator n=1 Tax=Microbacterium sp. SORGH_AS_0888 TaxID=3041791 RepID=UPI002782C2C0|nr:TetR/AcrR family transcriptional regulator [Microbacterium sp. SORGH_AS_0888]MDQ1129780.1 AcrR family transcriptional regulator [Microbacterium sp. SORGH_AS_0888]